MAIQPIQTLALSGQLSIPHSNVHYAQAKLTFDELAKDDSSAEFCRKLIGTLNAVENAGNYIKYSVCLRSPVQLGLSLLTNFDALLVYMRGQGVQQVHADCLISDDVRASFILNCRDIVDITVTCRVCEAAELQTRRYLEEVTRLHKDCETIVVNYLYPKAKSNGSLQASSKLMLGTFKSWHS
jgi:hypothetical protein